MRNAEKEEEPVVRARARFNVAVDTRSPSIIPYLYQRDPRGGIATAGDQCGHDYYADYDDESPRFVSQS